MIIVGEDCPSAATEIAINWAIVIQCGPHSLSRDQSEQPTNVVCSLSKEIYYFIQSVLLRTNKVKRNTLNKYNKSNNPAWILFCGRLVNKHKTVLILATTTLLWVKKYFLARSEESVTLEILCDKLS